MINSPARLHPNPAIHSPARLRVDRSQHSWIDQSINPPPPLASARPAPLPLATLPEHYAWSCSPRLVLLAILLARLPELFLSTATAGSINPPPPPPASACLGSPAPARHAAARHAAGTLPELPENCATAGAAGKLRHAAGAIGTLRHSAGALRQAAGAAASHRQFAALPEQSARATMPTSPTCSWSANQEAHPQPPADPASSPTACLHPANGKQ